MKVVYCGYGRAALECLYQLMCNFDVKASNLIVFTYDLESNKEFIKILTDNNIRFSFDNVNTAYREIKLFQPQYLFSVYYKSIIIKNILDIVDQKAINLHPSLLPKYRGAKSSVWALLNNERKTGVSFHYMDNCIDEGKVILQCKMNILDEDTAYSLYHKLISLFVVNFRYAFELVISGYKGIAQDGESSYYSRELPFNGKIKFSEVNYKTAVQFVKAMYFPAYKGALFQMNNGQLVEINRTDDLKKYIKFMILS